MPQEITFNEMPQAISELIGKVDMLMALVAGGKSPEAAAPLPEIMSIDQAADFLGRKKATLYSYVSKRSIPFSKKGKILSFRRSHLMAWIEQGHHKTIQEEIADAEAVMIKANKIKNK